ncbi:MAG: tripartite tricarboxylate transporter substrate binding protein [Comamonadaceae bacterium]|nr:MAG: tripartite tricarboxylate transporter substrate binding protein [Comamonadaceae bacterium]
MFNSRFKKAFTGAMLASFGLLATQAVQAQEFPSKPVRLVVPYSPGGLPDTVARIVSQRLSEGLGQPVVVDNKPGGSGAVAANTLAQSPADGYTLMLTDGPMLAITPLVVRKMAYDPVRDFAPVSLVGKAPLFLAVNANVKANTLDELIALAKASSSGLNYGSSGLGSIHHLTAEAMNHALGIKVTHVPFKGSANSIPALVGEQVDMAFASPPSLMGFAKSGKVKLLAINSLKRSPLAPNVPTLAERIPGFDFAFNVAVLAKAGTPKSVVDRLSNEFAKALKFPDVVQKLELAGVDPIGGSSEQLADALRVEAQRVQAAGKAADLKAE